MGGETIPSTDEQRHRRPPRLAAGRWRLRRPRQQPPEGGARKDKPFYGGYNDDLLSGDAGNDLIFGDSGNDTVRGGAGNDILSSGEGYDTFQLMRRSTPAAT